MSRGRRLRPALDLVNDIGGAAADLSAHGDVAALQALDLCARLNPDAFAWLRDRLLDLTRQPEGLDTPPCPTCQMLRDLRALEESGRMQVERDDDGTIRCRPVETS